MNEMMLVTGCAGLAVALMLIALLLERRKCRQLQQKLAAQESAEDAPAAPALAPDRVKPFAADLEQATRNRLKPRPHASGMSERYRYISAMARQGMTAVQIATALEIGEGEAAQIVRLVRRN